MRDFVPAGSYQMHARNVRMTLFCNAYKRNGSLIPASIDLTHLEETNIANEDGHLVNLDGDMGREGFLPNGSYLLTTVDHCVILSALCQRLDLRWQWNTLDVTHLNAMNTLSLVDGVLVVDPYSTN